jgi:hypothetical protein
MQLGILIQFKAASFIGMWIVKGAFFMFPKTQKHMHVSILDMYDGTACMFTLG